MAPKKNKLTNKQKRGLYDEDDIQQACVHWFRMTYSDLGHYLWHTPNGGHRHIKVAAKMKAIGTQPGVPDLFLAIPNGDYGGMFIEMKHPDNYNHSKHQKKMLKALKEAGYYVVERCTSVDQFIREINYYFDLK